MAVAKRSAVLVVGGLTGAYTVSASELDCREVLSDVLRLVVVAAADVDKPAAVLETFVREAPASPWRPVGGLRTAVVGLKGLAWGAGYRRLARPGEPLKQEGDKRSPIGIYRVGAPFGFEAATEAGHLKLEKDRHICVEDTRSPMYGRIVARSEIEPGIKFDQMRDEPLYRTGFVVDYPADREGSGGSCIFLHVWRKPGQGTAGCVAMQETDVGELRTWVSAAPSAIAILPAAVRERFAGCLP